MGNLFSFLFGPPKNVQTIKNQQPTTQQPSYNSHELYDQFNRRPRTMVHSTGVNESSRISESSLHVKETGGTLLTTERGVERMNEQRIGWRTQYFPTHTEKRNSIQDEQTKCARAPTPV